MVQHQGRQASPLLFIVSHADSLHITHHINTDCDWHGQQGRLDACCQLCTCHCQSAKKLVFCAVTILLTVACLVLALCRNQLESLSYQSH